MWSFIMFDLPVHQPELQKEYREFVKQIETLGYNRFQYSIFKRFCQSSAKVTAIEAKVKLIVPPQGKITLLRITDAQFGRMITFDGRVLRKHQSNNKQLLIF